MKLSVITPALNEASNIARAVVSAWNAGAEEVIVADGGSQDETCASAKNAGAAVIESPRGRARQQNAGAARATGEALVFLHADNWLEAGALQQIKNALRQSHVLWGALRQRIESSQLIYRVLERGNAERVRWWGLPYGDQAIFVRRDAFQELNGFPEVPLLEDVLLGQSLRRRAWPVLLPGRVHISPRRWQKEGVLRQTWRNWRILAAFACGVSPERLAKLYAPHLP